MQKQKNIRLLIILGAIITIISTLQLLLETDNTLSVDKKQFTLNQQTVITDVILESNTATNKLSYMNGSWQINEKYEIDPNMRDVFFSVLSQLEIRKPVASSQNDSITKLATEKGIHLSILNNQDTLKSYWILGDDNLQVSYLVSKEGNAYTIHIPGYRSFVAGIYNVPESDWRTRRIFTALFTNLNSFKINYPNDEIEFRYKNSFFEVMETQADSTQLITSLENLLFLQTDQYLQKSDYLKYLDTNPQLIAELIITKLSGAKEKVTLMESMKEPSYFVGILPDSSYCLFNKKRLSKILVKKSDFQ